jgi:alkanesulfonate monooxygenase SsuD/methylene tetrahydromethanopterin reductase-like flavin-dependent oxidoreductase (luciferase family)
MQSTDLGVFLPANVAPFDLRSLVARLDDEGYHSVWFTETDLVRDPLVHAAAAAVLSDRLVVGIGLVNVWRQIPSALATSVANVAALADGRHWLVLGPWHEPAATHAGVQRHHLVDAMTDTSIIVRGLLRGETVTHTGTVYSVDHLTPPSGPTRDMPVLWGANGPRMVAAAAELTAAGLIDGVMVNYLTPVERVRQIISTVTAAATDAGRDPTTLKFPIALIVLPGQDQNRSLEAMRQTIENTPVLRDEMHLPPDTPITNDLVAERVAAGTPDQCADRIGEYLEAGAWPVALYNPDPSSLLDQLTQH